jgi:nicotinamidase-related amidase
MEDTQQFAEFTEPGKCALVIWDVQNMLVNGIFNKDEFLSNTKSLISAARTREVPIFFTKITPLPGRFESPARKFFAKSRPRNISFTPEGLNLAIDTQEGDIVLNKNTASIFVGTNFELAIRNAGISTIVFTGIATEMGIESSAREALNRGFFPVVIKDAVSSRSKEAHERSLQNLAGMMLLLSTNELISFWKK